MERKLDIYRRLRIALPVTAVCMLTCMGDTCTDEELRHDVLEFLTTRYCGNFRGRRVLTNEIRFDGDTNRLACVLTEFAVTNDERIAARAMRQLGEYGTIAQLPFLYSCATNPIIGDRVVKSILRIEGVSSNSLFAVQSYLSMTNGFPLMNKDDRVELCESVIGMVFADSELICFRPLMLDVAYSFANNGNMFPNSLDLTLLSVDPGYRYTKRRLSILRSTRARLNERIQSWNTNDVRFATEVHIYDVQTNYLSAAIGELVAYPEANLPD